MSQNKQKKEQSEKVQHNFLNIDEGGGGVMEKNQTNNQVVGKARNNQQAQIDQFQRYLSQQGGELSYRKSKRKPQGQGKSLDHLIKRIFQSTAKFEEFNKLCQQQKRSICSNMIGKSDLYFQCFDCNKESQDTILCQSCFVKGSHTYHKVVYFNDMDDGGQCDCGDTSQKYPTFCEDHPVKKKETEHEKQRMLALISPEIRDKITEYFEQEFIKIFKALDTAKSGQCFSISQDIFQLLNNMICLMNNRVPMIYLISDLLTKHLDFQPASYEKHIQDQIITINQSPHPSFISKNKKTNKKKRQFKEIKDESSSQNVASSSNINQSTSTGLALEDTVLGSSFKLSNSFPLGAIHFQENNGFQRINNGSGILNNLQISEGENSIFKQLASNMGGPINQQLANYNTGFNLNDISYFLQKQNTTTFDNNLNQNPQILTNSVLPQAYFTQDNIFSQNSDPIQQTSIVSSNNLGGITSLNNLPDIQVSQSLNQNNQFTYNANPNTPYNTGLAMNQYMYASPFINNMGGSIMQTPFAFQQMASPSPFWTYSPYIPQQIPQFGGKLDQNFMLSSANVSSSTPAQVNLLSTFYQNQALQQQFYLPPPMQLLQEQKIEQNNNPPSFAQPNLIQESSLLTAPSPIQKLDQQNENNQNTKGKSKTNYDLLSTKTNQEEIKQINDSNKEIQKQMQDEDDKKIIDDYQNIHSKQNNSATGSINIFKFLSSSRVSFGFSDTPSIFGNQTKPDAVINDEFEQENKQEVRENTISFSQPVQTQIQQVSQSTEEEKNSKKVQLFEDEDHLSQFQQFKSQIKKKFVEFPSVPLTPQATNLNTPQDNNQFLQQFQIDNSNFQFSNSSQNSKKWIEFPSLGDQTNKESTTQIQNSLQTKSSVNNSSKTNQQQNFQSVKSTLNQLENQSPTNSNDNNIQSNQNDSENASKSSQDINRALHKKVNEKNFKEQLQQQQNKMEEESEDASSSPSKQDRDMLQFTIQQKKNQQQIISQILKRRATLEIDEILGVDKSKQENELMQRKKQHVEEQFEQQKVKSNQVQLLNQKSITQALPSNQEIEIEQDKKVNIEEQKEQTTDISKSLKSQLDDESEKEKWCLLELLFLYYPKYCNDQTDKNLQKVIMITFLDQIFRPLLVKFYTTYFDLIIETSKFEFYIWKICFQFFNESLESDFVINNTVMIEKVVKGVEEITEDFKTPNYEQTNNKRKILETIVLAFLQQRNAKYYGRTNRKLLKLYLESMSQSNLMKHLSFDHSCEYLNFEAILTRISQLINRNVRSIFYIDSQTFVDISQSIFNQLNNFINSPLFADFVLQFSVPTIQHLKKKDDGKDSEKMYPFFNNKLRIFLIYFAQFYVESTSPPAQQQPSAPTQNLSSNQQQSKGSSRQSISYMPINSSQNLGRQSFSQNLQTEPSQVYSNSSLNSLPDNLGENFDFYQLLKQFLPNEFGSNESIDNLLINLTGYLTKVLYFVELKERNYDLNDPTAHLLAEEEGFDNHNSELTLLQLYKSSKLYDYDFSCLQFIFSLIPNNNLTIQAMWQAIQSLINKEKITQQTQQHLFELSIEKIISDQTCQLNLEFFLFTLCNICINSVSLLNALSPSQKLQNVSWMKQSVEFAVIMSFFDKPLQDFYQVKENLKERFEINVQYLDLEGCVSKVAEWDENHKKFRLKKEFQNMFEPYYAERNRALANDMYQTLKQQMQKDVQSDLILGNMLEFMEIKRCHNEKKNKRNIFSQNQSLLLRNTNFLQLLSKICENLKEISSINMNIAKHAVKLLQIVFIRSSIDRKNHQILNSNSDKNSQSSYNMQSTITNNSSQQQQTQQNVNGLLQEDLHLFRLFVSNQKIKEQLTNYSSGKEDDLKRSTKKIINIFNAFQEIYQKENSIILMQIRRRNSSVDEENKKSEIKSQQQRIMEEFRKKQQNFLQKSSNNNNTTNNVANNNLQPSIQTNQDLICSTQSIGFTKSNEAQKMTQTSLACLMDQNDDLSQFQVSEVNLQGSRDVQKPKRSNPPLPPECLICRTTSTEKSAVLVIPCYLAPDNLFNYFLKESFCDARLQTASEQIDSLDYNKKSLQKQDLKKSQFSWSFTGCTHQVHSKCHLDAQQNLSIKKKARSQNENPLNQNESFCAHCKSLLNISLVNIEYFLNSYDFLNMIERLNNSSALRTQSSLNQSTSIQQQENIKENQLNQNNKIDQLIIGDKTHNTSKDENRFINFSNSPQISQTGYLSLPEIIQEIAMIQEELVSPKTIRSLIREDIDENCKLEIEELFRQLRKEIENISAGEDMGSIFQKCAYFMSERYLNKDVISYIQKEMPMSKSIILNFAVLLQENPPSIKAIKYVKNRLIAKLLGMKNLNDLILKQIDKNDSIDEIFVEVLVDVLYLGFLYDPQQQKTVNSYSIYEERGRQRPRDGYEWTFAIVTSLLKIIKMNVVIQVACLLQASTSSFDQNPSQIIGFKNILESIKANSQFRASLFNMVRPFIQMLVCFLLTVFPFSQTQLELLQKNILLDEDEYVHYETILSKEFMTIDPIQTIQATGGELFLKNFLEILQNKEIQIKLQQFFIHNPFREFKLVQLPPSYADFHKAFFFRKCSLCNFFPKQKGSDLHICLICGEVLCSYKCSPKQQSNGSRKKQKMQIEQDEIKNDTYEKFFTNYFDSSDFEDEPGNLSRHAVQKHCGKSAFLNIQRTTYILIDFPKAIQFHTKVFSNRIGIPFLTGKPLIDWNKYFIDKKIIDHIQQIIQDRLLSQYIRHQLMIKQSENNIKPFNLMSLLP